MQDKQGGASSCGNLARLYTERDDGKSAVPLLKEAFALWKETDLSYKSGVSDVLEVTAKTQYLQKHWIRAALLYSATERLRAKDDLVITGYEQELQQRDLEAVRQHLTDDEWETCRLATSEWDWEDAVREALTDLENF